MNVSAYSVDGNPPGRKFVEHVDADHKEPLPKCTAHCYVRSILQGLGMFGMTFAAVYFAQQSLVKRYVWKLRAVNRMQLMLPALLASACDYKVTNFGIDNCPHKMLAKETITFK